MDTTQGMFTLKWLMPEGVVHYYTASSFTVVPAGPPDPKRPAHVAPMPGSVVFDIGGGGKGTITRGVVYVLNAQGTTVDTLTLPADEPAQPAPDAQPPAPEPPMEGEVLDPEPAPARKAKTRATARKPRGKPRLS